MATVKLHIGPHKTATTRIQACFAAKAEALSEAGIEYRSVGQIARLFRGGIRKVGLGRVSVEEAAAQIKPRLGGEAWKVDDLLLSFENSVGISRHVLMPGTTPYEQLEKRLGLLQEVFADRDVTIFLAVRSYDKFFNSAYSEAVRARFDISPEALGPFLMEDHLRWPDFVARVRQVFPDASVRVWEHEKYRDQEAKVLGAISGAPESLFANELPDADFRVSLSRDAVRALLAIQPHLPNSKLRDGPFAIAEALEVAFPVTQENPTVSLWSDDELARLKAEYADDVAEIKTMDGVDVVLA
ncbi:MAG: hypothetical protein AAGF13_06815 [Pseudomonadota bacterium]